MSPYLNTDRRQLGMLTLILIHYLPLHYFKLTEDDQSIIRSFLHLWEGDDGGCRCHRKRSIRQAGDDLSCALSLSLMNFPTYPRSFALTGVRPKLMTKCTRGIKCATLWLPADASETRSSCLVRGFPVAQLWELVCTLDIPASVQFPFMIRF